MKQKQCWIRRRYLVKRTGSICAKIVNGEGREYTTCLHCNGAHSCDCKAGQRGVLCYHVKHLRAKEAQRSEKSEKAPVMAQTGKDSRKREQEAAPADVERMMSAPLTGNRPFRLMR